MNKIDTRARLLATSALCALTLGAAPSLAAAATPTSSSDAGTTTSSEVVVTGSHIPKPNLEQPAPVEVVPQQVIVDAGTPSLGNIIAQLPAMSAQATIRSNANIGGIPSVAGEDFADLRNLGAQRTLVLVDGKRHVAGDIGSDAVDLSSIPPALVDHIEVVTGGASAIYGSDALAGVVNIILKKNFQGEEIQAEEGQIEPRGIGQYYNLNFTVGQNFLNDRANLTITGLYDHQQQVRALDVPQLKNYGTIVNPNDEDANGNPIPNDGKPDRLIVANVFSPFIDRLSVLLDGFTGNLIPITAAGTVGQLATPVGFNSQLFFSFPGGCQFCLKTEDYEDIIPHQSKGGGELRFFYDVTPNVRFILDAKYIRSQVFETGEADFSFASFPINPNNAFITPTLRAQLPAFQLNNDGLFLDRFLDDLTPFGGRGDEVVRQTYRVVTGFDGTVDAKLADLTWEVTYNYGTTRTSDTQFGNQIPGNFQAALQSVIDPTTGKPACEINVPSVAANDPFFVMPTGLVNPSACVPYNPFGKQDNAAAGRFISPNLHISEAIVQQVVDGNFSFDSSRFFKLPGGPLEFAFGGEWRKENLSNRPDPLETAGLTSLPPIGNFFGGFNVYEGYIEANAPILRHQFLADELSVDAAYRVAHYSTVGTVDAWKVSGIYGPIPDLKFRATYSEAVRAPNISEAFTPPSGTFFNSIADPCSAENIGSNANFAKNCAAQGVPAGFVAQTNVGIPGLVSGNPDLKPERSQSYTIGLVAQPNLLPRLSITVDYYNIQIKDAITEPSAQSIINNCFSSAAGLDPTFCDQFTRDPATHEITFITDTFLNAAALETQGIETQINYYADVGPWTAGLGPLKVLDGRLTTSADVNWLFRLRNFPFQSNPKQFQVLEGEIGFPEWKALLTLSYTQGRWSFDWQTNFISKVDRYDKSPGNEAPIDQISPLFVGEQWYDNVVVHFRPDATFGHGKLDLYVGINDLLNAIPPPDVIAGNPGGAADGSAYYPLGREVFAGIKAKF